MAKRSSKKAKDEKEMVENSNGETQVQEQELSQEQEMSAKKEDENAEGVQEGESQDEKTEPSIEEQLKETQDKYLRLSAEFDNFRKRTLKEKMELIKSGGESVLSNILPIVDDFERAIASSERTEDVAALKEGMSLIKNKFNQFLEQNGVKEIEAKEKDFDTDLHEAVTKIPAPSEELKGKVVDVIEKGYYLHEKVLRFSKVVVGE